jgi:hypothetical protein
LLSRKNLLVVLSWDLNSGLPYSRPACYQLSYAAPYTVTRRKVKLPYIHMMTPDDNTKKTTTRKGDASPEASSSSPSSSRNVHSRGGLDTRTALDPILISEGDGSTTSPAAAVAAAVVAAAEAAEEAAPTTTITRACLLSVYSCLCV